MVNDGKTDFQDSGGKKDSRQADGTVRMPLVIAVMVKTDRQRGNQAEDGQKQDDFLPIQS